MTQQNDYYGPPSAADRHQPPIPAPQPAASVPIGQPPVVAPFSAQPAAQPKKRGWIVALVAIIAVFALLFFALSSCASAVFGSSGSSGNYRAGTVAVINIAGTIQYDGSECSPEGLKSLLDKAEDDPNVVAVVLRVNSGGGTATAGEEMAEYVKQFKAAKPIVVSSASINASAAYEISSQADKIFVAKTTEIGAIGTVMRVTDLSGLLDKLGIKTESIASAESKDSSYGTRPLTKKEREYYQRMVDQINESFVSLVAQGRNMKVEDIRKLANGLVYTGVDAVENHLADKEGTLEDAVAEAAALAGASAYESAPLELESDPFDNLLDILSQNKTSKETILEALKELDSNDSLS